MPSALGSYAIGSQAIGGNPVAQPAGKFQLIPRYKIRVLDPVSGAVVIDPLPHPHQSIFEVILPQVGMAGISSIGSVRVPLFTPLTDEYAWAKALYDKLDHLQRLEFYPIEDDGGGVSGDPVCTAVITELPKSEGNYTIQALDSMYLAQLSRTLRANTFNDRTDLLFRYALKGYQMAFGSDLSSLAPFTNDGGWTLVTDQGFKAVQCGGSGDGLLYTTTSYANSKYADMVVEAPFHVTVEQISGKSASAECVAALADANNYVLGRAVIRFLAANSRLAVDAEIWQKSGGVLTMKAQTKTEIAAPSVSAQCTITLAGYQPNATTYGWRVLVNQQDTNTVWYQNVSTGSPTGSIGVRSYKNGVQSNEIAVVQHHIVFLSKTAIFQPGNIGVGAQVNSQPIPQQPMIDLLQLAAATEGWGYRKNPKAGLNNDTMDFNASPGGDLSGMVRFEEGVNIVSGGNEANAEPFNTAIIGTGSPGFDGEGQQSWYDITAINKYGLILDVVSLSHVTDSFSLRKAADSVLNNRKAPSQAKRFTVLRDERHGELPGVSKPTGLSYREGDWVELHVPRQGLYHQRAQIISVKIQEGSPTMELTFDQYPRTTDRDPVLDRRLKLLADLALRTSEQSIASQQPVAGQSFTSGGPGYDRRLVLPINPWKMRVYQTAAQNIPDNSTVVQGHIAYDTVTYDSSNGFDTTTHQWTVSVSGYYLVSATLGFTLPAVNNAVPRWQLGVYVNGVISEWGPTGIFTQPAVGVGYFQSASVSESLYLNAGDTVFIDLANVNGGGVWPVFPGTNYTYWSTHLISG